ncbi:MAG: hypothetical protein LBP53_04095 [Candidatus Peribacteria bacterium]|jgi:C-terminal processing protease CtpA/Prc|nr:hypothetical protein [Candidatus Peribacteria bacterium]
MKLKTPFFLHSCLILLSGVICGVLLTFFVIKPDEWWRNVLTSFAQQEQKFTKFTLIDQLLADEYWDKDNLASAQPRMIDNALRSYVAGIDDPYTNYLTAEENTQLVQSLHEETGIEGIGAVIEKRDNYIQIAEIIKH